MSVFRLVAATRAWRRATKRILAAQVPTIRYENTFQLGPDSNHTFSPVKVQEILQEVLECRLKRMCYSADACRQAATDLATAIKSRLKSLDLERYKLVCHVVIMENKGQGSEVASNCLWDTGTDSFASYTYRNETLVGVALVYGIYFE